MRRVYLKIRGFFLLLLYTLTFLHIPTTTVVYPAKPHETINVILFTIDSLRPDHLGCYGYKKDVSPTIDRLAKTGVIFNQAIAQSAWTTPGMISIFTSLYPHSHHVDARGKSLDGGIITLPKLLKTYGYTCPAFSYLIRDPNYFNLGFDPAPEHIYEGSGMEELFELLSICKDKRFFIWYHSKYIHLPYKVTPPYDQLLAKTNKEAKDTEVSSGLFAVKNNVIVRDGTVEFKAGDRERIIELYDINLKRLDDHISLLISKLKELKLSDHTLLIITADHGEELLDHGFVGHASTSLSAKLYDEIIRIPLIFWLPGHLSPERIDTQVQQIDIFPTILKLLGIPIPQTLQGRSLTSLMRGRQKGERRTLPESALSETIMGGYQSTEEMKQTTLTSLRMPPWKLIRKKRGEEQRYELYNLNKDPKEMDDVCDGYPEVMEDLKSIMEGLTGR